MHTYICTPTFKFINTFNRPLISKRTELNAKMTRRRLIKVAELWAKQTFQVHYSRSETTNAPRSVHRLINVSRRVKSAITPPPPHLSGNYIPKFEGDGLGVSGWVGGWGCRLIINGRLIDWSGGSDRSADSGFIATPTNCGWCPETGSCVSYGLQVIVGREKAGNLKNRPQFSHAELIRARWTRTGITGWGRGGGVVQGWTNSCELIR